jgi:glycosyltransferase involved in cell wall biosynthesis
MKVAVVNTAVPFLRGGAEILVDGLARALTEAGHEVAEVKVPLRWSSASVIAQSMLAATLVPIPQADVVIPLKFPAYLVDHPHKTVWLLHQFRQVYDFWGTPFQGLPDDEETAQLRAAIHTADLNAIGGAHAVFANSAVTAGRLDQYNGLKAEVLLPPVIEPEQYGDAGQGDYVFAAGRINATKRQELLLQALASTTSGVRLVIAGKPESDEELRRMTEFVESHGLEGRVQLIPRFITDAEKRDLMGGALAVAYLPVDEDSYGYVTAEAMLSSKPVLTTTDSGGVHELVEHEVTGLVAHPDPEGLATAMDVLYRNRPVARDMGVRARKRVVDLDLSWDNVLRRLLA